jgi:prepilin-type processing-associated H-X9-DG protein
MFSCHGRGNTCWGADLIKQITAAGGGLYVGQIGYYYWAYSTVSPEHAHGFRASGSGGDLCNSEDAAVKYPIISDGTQDNPVGFRWLWNHYDVAPAGWADGNARASGANMAFGDCHVLWYKFSDLHQSGVTGWATPAWHGHD